MFNKISKFTFVFAILPMIAFAQEVLDPMANDAFFAELAKIISGISAAQGSALAIAALCVQAIMFFFRTPMADWAGKWKLSAVTLLNIAAVILAGKITGMSWSAVLLSAPAVSSLATFGHQLLKQFSAPKA